MLRIQFKGFSVGMVLLLILLATPVSAKMFQDSSKLKVEVLEAESLINKGLYLPAIENLLSLQSRLESGNRLASSVGVRARERLAFAYLYSRQGDLALEMMPDLIKDSRELGEVIAEVSALLTFACVYQNLKREESDKLLREAGQQIKKHGLDSLEARWAIRKCSYFIPAGPRDSVEYFARLSLQRSIELNLGWERAYSHAMMNDIDPEGSFLDKIYNLRQFTNIYESMENYSQVVRGEVIMTMYYLNNGYLEEAMALSNSSFQHLGKMEERGEYTANSRAAAHHLRMEIFEVLGKIDSALYHAKAAKKFEREALMKINTDKLLEVEEKYRDTQREQTIYEQEQQLLFASRQRLLLGAILILIAGLALLSFYYYRISKQKNILLAAQSDELEVTNSQLTDSLREQLLLRGELHHRVKNNLQVIISLLDHQQYQSEQPLVKQSLQSTSERVYSIAAAHELLYPEQETTTISLLAYVKMLADHAASLWPEGLTPRVELDLPDEVFNLDTLVPIGVMLSELLTNTRKYFGEKEDTPVISISLKEEGDFLHLTYRDNGPGFPKGKMEERKGGMGHYLLASMARQLQGSIESTNENGAVVSIFFKKKNMPMGLNETELYYKS